MIELRLEDPYNLRRFVDAQEGVYEGARSEIKAGRKRGHWMWFIFPQIAGLGHSYASQKFAISSKDEAKSFLEHPILGVRLRECVVLANKIEDKSAEDIFGEIDSLKFRSSMTLFAMAATDNQIFKDALLKYFDGRPDPRTIERM